MPTPHPGIVQEAPQNSFSSAAAAAASAATAAAALPFHELRQISVLNCAAESLPSLGVETHAQSLAVGGENASYELLQLVGGAEDAANRLFFGDSFLRVVVTLRLRLRLSLSLNHGNHSAALLQRAVTNQNNRQADPVALLVPRLERNTAPPPDDQPHPAEASLLLHPGEGGGRLGEAEDPPGQAAEAPAGVEEGEAGRAKVRANAQGEEGQLNQEVKKGDGANCSCVRVRAGAGNGAVRQSKR